MVPLKLNESFPQTVVNYYIKPLPSDFIDMLQKMHIFKYHCQRDIYSSWVMSCWDGAGLWQHEKQVPHVRYPGISFI